MTRGFKPPNWTDCGAESARSPRRLKLSNSLKNSGGRPGEVGGVRDPHGLEGVGADEDDVHLGAVAVLDLRCPVGGHGGISILAEGLMRHQLILAAVVDQEEMLDVISLGRHGDPPQSGQA